MQFSKKEHTSGEGPLPLQDDPIVSKFPKNSVFSELINYEINSGAEKLEIRTFNYYF